MVDTGILPAHREFRNKNIIIDSVLNDTGRDNISHGTNVACIMVGDPGIIPEATLVSVKAFDVQHGHPDGSLHLLSGSRCGDDLIDPVVLPCRRISEAKRGTEALP